MNRMRVGATALGLALLLTGGVALAQETTGRVTGRVTDRDTGAAMGGVTVLVQGPQGEDATLTNEKGEYNFTTLPIGTYAIHFYAANTAVQVEQLGVSVSAEKTVRVNAKIAGAAQQATQQTYVITGRAPTIDIGSARVGATFDQDYTLNVPVGRTFGDIIERAPGAFIDGSGNVSIGGATGLENQYTINGMNVTGLRYGNIEMGLASHSGGSNLPVEFVSQID
ncbi:MAG: carboxypeptidase-like regulatory domain-containing protein, partial [Verrucomicrobiota bacterium]